jgi:hypothetical protein
MKANSRTVTRDNAESKRAEEIQSKAKKPKQPKSEKKIVSAMSRLGPGLNKFGFGIGKPVGEDYQKSVVGRMDSALDFDTIRPDRPNRRRSQVAPFALFADRSTSVSDKELLFI